MPKKSDCVLVISEDFYDPVWGYELHVVWPRAEGFHKTDFYCGHDFELALEWVNEINLQNGHNPKFVTKIIELVSGLSAIHFSGLQ